MEEDIEKIINSLVVQSNKYFNESQYVEAAVKAEKAYSLATNYDACPNLAKRKLEFNLACIYTAARDYDLAHGWLERLEGDSSVFPRRRELAAMYTHCANAFRARTPRTHESTRAAIECLRLAGEYYARCKMWHEFCLVNLTRAQMLVEDIAAAERVERGLNVANKILAATFYLDYDQVALAKIYNDLSTIFANDPFGLENVRYSRKLLKKALRIIQENERVDLEVYVYQNLAAISNQLENYDSALRYLELAYTLIGSESNQYHLVSDLKYNEGYASYKVKRMKNAIDAFSQSHVFALKTNQNNIWESLECLACVYSQLDEFENALVNIEKAIKYYGIYCEQKNLPRSDKIESRLSDKQKLISKHVKIDTHFKTSSTPAFVNGFGNAGGGSPTNGAALVELSDNEDVYYKSNPKISSAESHTGEFSKKDDDDEENEEDDDDERHNDDAVSIEGNQTVTESHSSMRRVIQELKAKKEEMDIGIEKLHDESDNSDDIRVFKDEIVYLNSKKDDDNRITASTTAIAADKRSGCSDDELVTAIRTNDSGDVVVVKLRKSELAATGTTVENNSEKHEMPSPPPLPPLVLKHRGSLDPDSSLKRDIDEYVRVMEKQEQLLQQQQQPTKGSQQEEEKEVEGKAPNGDATNKRKFSRQAEKIILARPNQLEPQQEEVNEKAANEEEVQSQPKARPPLMASKPKSTKICSIS